MREIKFRMWVPEENGEPGHMISGDNLAFEEYLPLTQLLSQEGVMQFTGLKDKNGVEIYEGDIVKVNCPYSFKLEVGIICYNDGCFDIIGNTGGRDYLKCHTVNHAVKVIGNIYDNPELLEAKA